MQIRLIKVSAVLLFPALLSGCIAAAIPVLAGSVMAGKDRVGIGSKSDNRDDPDPEVTVVATEDAPSELEAAAISAEVVKPEPVSEPMLEPEPKTETEPEPTEAVLALVEPVENIEPTQIPTVLEEKPEPTSVVLERVDAVSFNLAEARAPDTTAPAPAELGRVEANETKSIPTPKLNQPERRLAIAPKVPEQPRGIGITKAASSYRALSDIFAYVDAQAKRDPIVQPRLSAILAAPGSLTPDRSDCSIRPPAVIFDLDRTGAVFDPTVEIKAQPAMTQMLRSFRMQEIEVFWISTRAAVDAGKIRNRLIESGLDPVGRDGLLLMRRADDRKQARRRELSETHCVIAIAGDAKADFDELYDYLKDPSAAKPLDDLLGAGWFLTPLPLGNSPLPLLNQSNSEGQ